MGWILHYKKSKVIHSESEDKEMEYIDILDENGVLTGETIEKKKAHTGEGSWHKTVHVWIINSKGEILLQKRSPNKDTCPNMWDISAAGHMQAGESSLQGVYREVSEELGIEFRREDLEFLFCYKNISKSHINKEFCDVYLLKTEVDIRKMALQEDEVSEVKFISFKVFYEMIENKDKSLLQHLENKVIVNELQKRYEV